MDVGLLEGTRVLTFALLGFPASLGLTYGIARRVEQIFWAGSGLLLYGALVAARKRREAAVSVARMERTP